MKRHDDVWLFRLSESDSQVLLTSLLQDLDFWETPPSQRLSEHVLASKAWEVISQEGESNTGEEARAFAKKPKRQGSRRKLKVASDANDKAPEEEESLDMSWRAAIDTQSGRTYYYHARSNKTQWEKPASIRNMERRKRREQRKKAEAFFRCMEQNILASLQRGELLPGIPKKQTPTEGPPLEPVVGTAPAPSRVRTISCMNEHLLRQVHHNDGNSYDEPVSRPTLPRSRPTVPLEGRPPLPSASMMTATATTPSETSPPLSPDEGYFSKLDALEFSPDAPRAEFDSTDDLRGEHLLLDSRVGSPVDEEAIESPEPAVATKKSPPMGHLRRNTGNTIYVKSTMDNPDVNATITCVCGVYRAHILQGLQTGGPGSPISVQFPLDLRVFHDNLGGGVSSNTNTLAKIPSVQDLEHFYQEFFQRSQMEHDTIIMSLVYIERLIKETSGALRPTPENWRSVLFSCMIMASKVWDDLSMWNIDFSNLSLAAGTAPFSLQRINELEIAVLHCLHFNVKVAASEYAKYYFLIRTMLIRSGQLEPAGAPLGKTEAQTLEHKTQHYQETTLNRLKNKGLRNSAQRRTKSVDWGALATTGSRSAAGPVLNYNVCLEQLVSMKG